MDNVETISNLLVRDGFSQAQRGSSAPVTSDENVKLDRRSISDIIDFIYRYARHVLYYDESATEDALLPAGDWQNFFSENLPFSYAAINKFPVERLREKYEEVRARPFHQMEEFSLLINRISVIAIQLDTWHTSLKNTNNQAPLYRMLDTLIKSDLNRALYRLIGIANTLPEYDYSIAALIKKEAWGLTLERLVASDKSIERYNAYPRRKKGAVRKSLDEVFLLFYKGIQQVQQFAGDHFDEVLSGGQQHAAHLGLLYSFLKLFAQVQQGINGMAGKHLDFFYKEILQLKGKEAVPDHVHVIIELAKQTSTFLLKKDTPLNAGKDKDKDLVFLLEDDIVVNKAVVSSLRTLYKDTVSNIYVAPVANSADGAGEPFRDPAQNSWPLLGAKEYDDKNNPEINIQHYPFGVTGLIISSQVLLLKEGKREINIYFKLDNDLKGFVEALNIPVYILNENNFKLLAKAGLGGMFMPLLPAQQETGWFKVLTTKEWTETTKKFDGDLLQKAKKIMKVFILDTSFTSDKGWMRVDTPGFAVDQADPKKFRLSFTLYPGDPSILIPDPKQLKVEYPVKDPLIRVIFNHQVRNFLSEKTSAFYDLLSKSIIRDITINVTVTNAKELLLANDEGPLDSKKTFFPFTSVPKIGSNFYVGSDEAFRKKLTSFDLKVTWDGLPDDLKAHYQAYIPATVNLNETTATFKKLIDGNWVNTGSSRPIFENNPLPLKKSNSYSLSSSELPFIKQEEPLGPFNNSTVNGYLMMSLNHHFYHVQYPSALAAKLLGMETDLKLLVSNPNPPGLEQNVTTVKLSAKQALDQAIRLPPPPDQMAQMIIKTGATVTSANAMDSNLNALKAFVALDKPNLSLIPLPPYTPAIKEVSFDYKAEASFSDITLVHIYPFEESNYKLLEAKNEANCFPVFDDEGTLYIALEEATAGSNINLLFQLAEFTANPDIPAAEIIWQYLSGNEWKILQPEKDIISDTTIGFQVSGIVTLALPWDANKDHTILPAGKYWLKASAKKNTAAVCEGISISAQGAKAVFNNNENDLSRLALPLAPGSIASLREPRSEVKKISQDFPSFGGREPETEKQFYVRVSERLRHKGRAISVYDYEHLVLEAFPAVYKVKCIPHTKMCLATAEGTLLSSPGWVTLAVIPEINNFPASSRFQPKVSRIQLKEIQDYIQLKTSAFVNVQVVNPRYQKIDFSGSIFFKKGRDKNFYKDKLKQDVRNFLSPWILTGSQDIIFGGTLMMSSVLSFIEKQEYVEYVTDFKMLDGNVSVKGITALMPWSIFIAGSQDRYEAANDDG